MEISLEHPPAVPESILSVTARAGQVFANRQKALRWLHSPNPALGGLSPLQSAETPDGWREVEDILGRIEYGIIG
jgi:putative toxin-antitoxin system antitoxin component (TIGR02293 family)